ncbi:MAG: hypothetical protein JKY30_00065, partial [Flavobacteriales bacterium]|nr:hypothetical protein [Flavobacteriales bacterium]
AAKTWYYRGFIYKDFYKKKEKSNKVSPARLVAIDSFREMLKLKGKEGFQESSFNILKYLSSTLYNDAARMLDPDNYTQAMDNYEKFRNTMLIINSGLDLTAQDVKFKLVLASMLNRPAETTEGLDSVQLVQIKKLYIEILDLDSNNPGANYNLAILHYNEAADIINDMDYDMDIMKLNEVQDYCIKVFKEGLPYMMKSYELGYKMRETLIGLSNIYYGLNDIEKSELYKKELEELEAKKRYLFIKKRLKELEDKDERGSDGYKKYNDELKNLTDKFKGLEKE